MRRLLIVLALQWLAAAAPAAEVPNTVLQRSDAYRLPFDSFEMTVELTSYDASNSSSAAYRVFGKGGHRSVVEFTAPASERGRYLLMLRDAMWIYLPSASRPIRISPMQRLMGQASNGDVARTAFSVDYNATSAAEEEVDGRRAWLIELEAKDPSLAYKRLRLWTDYLTFEPIRADFHAVSGKLLKRAHYRKFAVVAGRRVVSEIEIEDMLREGRRTVMKYSKILARDNPDKMFVKDALGKW